MWTTFAKYLLKALKANPDLLDELFDLLRSRVQHVIAEKAGKTV